MGLLQPGAGLTGKFKVGFEAVAAADAAARGLTPTTPFTYQPNICLIY